jgi:hypothetical protein
MTAAEIVQVLYRNDGCEGEAIAWTVGQHLYTGDELAAFAAYPLSLVRRVLAQERGQRGPRVYSPGITVDLVTTTYGEIGSGRLRARKIGKFPTPAFEVLSLVDAAIVDLRERHGMAPLDDALPSEP